MILDLAREHGVDLGRSWTIGDARRDVEAARAAGTHSALVRTGKGAAELGSIDPPPEFVADQLDAAVAEVLRRMRERQGR
jgi:D-glycero-D-manno-heptose 1,7-bisphosphate phosphatase